MLVAQMINDKTYTLSPAVSLQPLPASAGKYAFAPHEHRGICRSCHPVTKNSSYPSQTAKALPKKWNSTALVLPTDGPAPVVSPPTGQRRWSGRSTAPSASSHAWLSPQNSHPPTAVFPPNQLWETGTGPNATAGNAKAGSAGQQLSGLLTPAQQNAVEKILVEGHWLGMELLDLTTALRRTYGIPDSVRGVIIDEVSLEAAQCGLLAGDVVLEVQGWQTQTLEDFLAATEKAKEQKAAEITVFRLGERKVLALQAERSESLGFAQMESASPIRPGALSPHKTRSKPCTACHVIMTSGGQLPVDSGDTLPNPPPIPKGQTAPHGYRGTCNSCHQIKSGNTGQVASQLRTNGIAPAVPFNAVAPHKDRGSCRQCHVITR